LPYPKLVRTKIPDPYLDRAKKVRIRPDPDRLHWSQYCTVIKISLGRDEKKLPFCRYSPEIFYDTNHNPRNDIFLDEQRAVGFVF
jgi:ribosomal protein L33